MKVKIRKLKHSKITVSSMGLLFIFTMFIANLHQGNIYHGYYLTPILISIFWFCVAFSKYLNDKNVLSLNFEYSYWVLKLNIFPWIIFIVYNIVIYVFNIAYRPFMKSSFVQIMFVPCIILGAIGSYYIFGKNTLRYFFYSLILYYIIGLPLIMIKMGPNQFYSELLGLFTGKGYNNPFERNSDMVFAMGILAIFYFNSFIKNRTRINNHFWVCFLLMLLGGKRIVIIAMLGLSMLNILFKVISEKKQYKLQTVVSVVLFIGMFIFVYFVKSGMLSSFVFSHNINTMGRINMWAHVAKNVEFSPTYLGKGYSYSNLLLEKDKVWLSSSGTAYALHSDILKIFFDMGFIIFCFWGVYDLFILIEKYRKKCGYEVSNLVWTLVIYLFILYFTDNAINYFITQTTFCICILESMHLKSKAKNKL